MSSGDSQNEEDVWPLMGSNANEMTLLASDSPVVRMTGCASEANSFRKT